MSKAALCQIVLEGPIDVDVLADRSGLSRQIFNVELSQLCRDGTFARHGDLVSSGNLNRVRMIAGSEPEPKKPKPALAPEPAPEPTKKVSILTREALPTKFEIAKGIPIPEPRLGRPYVCTWPFREMQIGDSFEIPVPDGSTANEVAALVRKDAGRHDRLFPTFRITTRNSEDGKGVRVWRIEPTEKTKRRSAKAANDQQHSPVASPPPNGKEGAGARVRRRAA